MQKCLGSQYQFCKSCSLVNRGDQLCEISWQQTLSQVYISERNLPVSTLTWFDQSKCPMVDISAGAIWRSVWATRSWRLMRRRCVGMLGTIYCRIRIVLTFSTRFGQGGGVLRRLTRRVLSKWCGSRRCWRAIAVFLKNAIGRVARMGKCVIFVEVLGMLVVFVAFE